MVPVLEARKLSHIYEKRQVLKDVSFSLDRGDALALIGPNGSGKTTLLRLLDLLEKPCSGQIYFDGTDVTRSGRSRLSARRKMAFVHQKPIVFKMNVYNNVACGLKFRHVNRAVIRRSVDSVLELVGMSAYRNRDARTLSGGEMQRIAIARALVTRPEVLLLDEPTANLDPASVAKIEEILARIIGKGKIAVLMVTHDMAQGQRVARKIGVLVNGEILQIGSTGDIFFAPASTRVAEFVGVENILPGTIVSKDNDLSIINVNGIEIQAITALALGENVHVMIRPEDITITKARELTSARNNFEGRIKRVIPLGPLTRIEVDCGLPLFGVVTTRSAGEMELIPDSRIFASFKATAIHVIKRA